MPRSIALAAPKPSKARIRPRDAACLAADSRQYSLSIGGIIYLTARAALEAWSAPAPPAARSNARAQAGPPL